MTPEYQGCLDTPQNPARATVAERPVLRAIWAVTAPLELAPDRYQPKCQLFVGRDYCEERATQKITVRVIYENCCKQAPLCVCGGYTEIVACEEHARRYKEKP